LEKEENLVKKTCRELGITQKELAEKIGISDRTLSRYATNIIPKNIELHLNLLLQLKNKNEIIQNLKFTIKTIS